MPSISSSRKIRERTREFCSKIKNWNVNENNLNLLEKIDNFLKKEYEIIPGKERIGKGIVYISKYFAKEMCLYFKENSIMDIELFKKFIENGFNFGEKNDSPNIQHFVLLLMAEFPIDFEIKIPFIEKWADHDDWAIRETTCASILYELKRNPEKLLKLLLKWVKSENQNLRRIVSESLRPMAEVKWLRDPNKNDEILEILTLLRKDPSIYVRKSVGNNIKDLSKYMPEKTLDLMESWLNSEPKIKIHDELAMEVGLSPEEKRLIWTIKHAMRWLKERNPEFHPRLEKILGKNYILYYNEKKNRLARPK